MNVLLYANFAKTNDGEVDTKHFNTANNITDTTYFKKWYQENATNTILTKSKKSRSLTALRSLIIHIILFKIKH